MASIHQKYSRILRLPQNPLGRDFVVGDIHGAYDQVLAAVNYPGLKAQACKEKSKQAG